MLGLPSPAYGPHLTFYRVHVGVSYSERPPMPRIVTGLEPVPAWRYTIYTFGEAVPCWQPEGPPETAPYVAAFGPLRFTRPSLKGVVAWSGPRWVPDVLARIVFERDPQRACQGATARRVF